MILLHILQLSFVHVVSSVIFEDCGSAYELQRVKIRGCGMRLPCYITLGENVPVTMEFYSDFVSRKLDQDVVININFISSKTLVTPDPCATVHCPVKSDAVTSFTSVMSVPTNVAMNRRGFLQWRVYNEENRLVLCYSVLVQTQSPIRKLLREILNRKDPKFDVLVVDNYKTSQYKNLTNTENIKMQKHIGNDYKIWKVK